MLFLADLIKVHIFQHMYKLQGWSLIVHILAQLNLFETPTNGMVQHKQEIIVCKDHVDIGCLWVGGVLYMGCEIYVLASRRSVSWLCQRWQSLLKQFIHTALPARIMVVLKCPLNLSTLTTISCSLIPSVFLISQIKYIALIGTFQQKHKCFQDFFHFQESALFCQQLQSDGHTFWVTESNLKGEAKWCEIRKKIKLQASFTRKAKFL